MKKTWVKLWDLACKTEERERKYGSKNYGIVDTIYTHMFLKHHQYACSIVLDLTGRPLKAIYECGDLRDKINSNEQYDLTKTSDGDTA